ncbi:MAG: beta-ketoacyl synthase N-terminal-like domain-containing protein, partial [Defluviicoccus sp.]|nr:beta-ketoacyl synthase N-terminal-like domain-containing protein [Defluviicoccus sp.]
WPKVLGAWHLHRATEDRDLDLFILFSSAVGILGSAGQANHAAANAFLDQLAAHRRARGLPGQAVAWGAWSEVGEAEEHRDRIEEHLAARGVRWITPQQALRAFDQFLSQDLAGGMVTAVDWSVYAESFGASPTLLEDLLTRTATEPEREAATPENDLLSRLRAVPAGEREDVLATFIQEELQSVLRLSAPPSPTARFFDLGMDSLMAVELRNRLNRGFAGAYVASNTVVFDYPDTAALAHFLAGELGEIGADEPPAAGAVQTAQRERRVSERRMPAPRPDDRVAEPDGIAIVGMACRFPGATGLAGFWDELVAGVDAVTDGRPDSGHRPALGGDPESDNASYRCGGFVAGIDEFDARFFGIRPIEARTMDPQQRMLLETSWQALEDAGMDPDGLRGSRTGVYVGISGCEYRDLIARSGADIAYLGTAGSVAAGRISFALGLMGPAMPLDMTCASSLAAVHEAGAALRRGEVDLALAGGVNAILSPAVTKFMVEIGMLSPTGRCRTFDAAADGYVRGEGCGIVVLKRLAEAVADGDRIWGVVRGSAVNQNGASAGLTVPNGPAQEQVLEEAVSRAGVPPESVDYLEAHGTGSGLGDPIEVQAAAAVYGRGRGAARPLLMGTVKTNIGHLEAAAGVAGIIKVVLAMRHGVIPKHLNFDTPNPHLDWDRLPVRVTSKSTDWPRESGRPPRAAVSAFGISGTNAHLVVEGYEAPRATGGLADGASPEGAPSAVGISLPVPDLGLAPAPQTQEPRATRLLPLSGKSDGALRALAGRYLAWLDERNGAAADGRPAAESLLTDMAWTAGVGRSHFAHRAGVVFHDAASLEAGLRAVAEAESDPGAREPAKAAFVYAEEGGPAAAVGEALYRGEPVVRALVDRCDAVYRKERGASLLDAMFGGSGAERAPGGPASFALQCALTALWASVGVRPSTVVGFGVGELAAAHAAGVLGLEDGLRLAVARDALARTEPAEPDIEAALAGIEFRPPAIALVSGVSGRVVGSEEVSEAACGLRRLHQPAAQRRRSARTMAERGVEVVVEIGPRGSVGSTIASAWPESATGGETVGNGVGGPVVLPGPGPADGDGFAANGDTGFVRAVAGAYEAGLPVAFAGLHAGETRRRISVPGYPFEPRRYWIETPKR